MEAMLARVGGGGGGGGGIEGGPEGLLDALMRRVVGDGAARIIVRRAGVTAAPKLSFEMMRSIITRSSGVICGVTSSFNFASLKETVVPPFSADDW